MPIQRDSRTLLQVDPSSKAVDLPSACNSCSCRLHAKTHELRTFVDHGYYPTPRGDACTALVIAASCPGPEGKLQSPAVDGMLYAATFESLSFATPQGYRGNSPHALLLQDPDQKQALAALQSIDNAADSDLKPLVMVFAHGRMEQGLQYAGVAGGGEISLDGHVEAGENDQRPPSGLEHNANLCRSPLLLVVNACSTHTGTADPCRNALRTIRSHSHRLSAAKAGSDSWGDDKSVMSHWMQLLFKHTFIMYHPSFREAFDAASADLRHLLRQPDPETGETGEQFPEFSAAGNDTSLFPHGWVTHELLDVQEVLHRLCWSNCHSPNVPGLLTQLLGLLQQPRSKQLVLRWGLLLIVAQDISNHTELDWLMAQQVWMRDCITLPMYLLHLAAVGDATAKLAKDVMLLLLPPLSHYGTGKLQQVEVEVRCNMAEKLRNSPLGLVHVPFVRQALLLEAPDGLKVAGQLLAAEAAGSSAGKLLAAEAAGSSDGSHKEQQVAQQQQQQQYLLATMLKAMQQLEHGVGRLQQLLQHGSEQLPQAEVADAEAAVLAAAAAVDVLVNTAGPCAAGSSAETGQGQQQQEQQRQQQRIAITAAEKLGGQTLAGQAADGSSGSSQTQLLVPAMHEVLPTAAAAANTVATTQASLSLAAGNSAAEAASVLAAPETPAPTAAAAALEAAPLAPHIHPVKPPAAAAALQGQQDNHHAQQPQGSRQQQQVAEQQQLQFQEQVEQEQEEHQQQQLLLLLPGHGGSAHGAPFTLLQPAAGSTQRKAGSGLDATAEQVTAASYPARVSTADPSMQPAAGAAAVLVLLQQQQQQQQQQARPAQALQAVGSGCLHGSGPAIKQNMEPSRASSDEEQQDVLQPCTAQTGAAGAEPAAAASAGMRAADLHASNRGAAAVAAAPAAHHCTEQQQEQHSHGEAGGQQQQPARPKQRRQPQRQHEQPSHQNQQQQQQQQQQQPADITRSMAATTQGQLAGRSRQPLLGRQQRQHLAEQQQDQRPEGQPQQQQQQQQRLLAHGGRGRGQPSTMPPPASSSGAVLGKAGRGSDALARQVAGGLHAAAGAAAVSSSMPSAGCAVEVVRRQQQQQAGSAASSGGGSKLIAGKQSRKRSKDSIYTAALPEQDSAGEADTTTGCGAAGRAAKKQRASNESLLEGGQQPRQQQQHQRQGAAAGGPVPSAADAHQAGGSSAPGASSGTPAALPRAAVAADASAITAPTVALVKEYADHAAGRDAASGFHGVSFDKGIFKAQVQYNGEISLLGRFHMPEDAARAYDMKLLQLSNGTEDDCTLNFAKSDYYKGSQLLELPTKPERGKGKVPQSKYKCVSWNISPGRWRARYEDRSTGRDRSYTLIGLFNDELMAAVAADVSTVRRPGPDGRYKMNGANSSMSNLSFRGLLPEYFRLMGFEATGDHAAAAQEDKEDSNAAGVAGYLYVRECPYDKERFIAFAPRSIGNKPNLKKHLGVFDTAEAAARAYDDAVLRDDEVGLGRHSTVTAVGRAVNFAPTEDAVQAAEARGRPCRQVGSRWYVVAPDHPLLQALGLLRSSNMARVWERVKAGEAITVT